MSSVGDGSMLRVPSTTLMLAVVAGSPGGATLTDVLCMVGDRFGRVLDRDLTRQRLNKYVQQGVLVKEEEARRVRVRWRFRVVSLGHPQVVYALRCAAVEQERLRGPPAAAEVVRAGA